MSTYHDEDLCSGKLPDILDELLKPAPRLLCLLDRGQFRPAGLVLRELRTDQVKYWGNSFLELDAVRFPGVPFLDQLIEMFLSVDFKYYDKVFKKKPSKQLATCYGSIKRRENCVDEKDETALTSQVLIHVLQLLANPTLGLQCTSTLLVELVPLFSETLDLLLQT